VTPETLDESLDRVATAMTAVPVDATFVTRLQQRLDHPRRFSLGVHTIGVAAAAAAIVLAAFVVQDSGRAPIRQTQSHSATSRIEPVAPAVVNSPPPGVGVPAPSPVAMRYATSDPANLSPPAIPALATPADLALGHLQVEPLIVAPVDMATLEIAELSIADLGATDEPKE